MRQSFVHNKAPMIVGVIKERTPFDVIAKIREGEAAGARGFDLHVSMLDEQYRNVESLKEIIESTDKPILSMNYNIGYDGPLNMTDDERMETLIMAAEAGTAAVDVQGYTYNPDAGKGFTDDEYATGEFEFLKTKRPKEVCLRPEVIQKQKDFVAKIHSMGAEVLGSVHFGTILSKEELVTIANFTRSKGFDMVKMVAPCTDIHQVPEAIESIIHLNDTLDCPFAYHMSGKPGLVTRKIGPLFGSYIMFCNVTYGKNSDLEQLHCRSMVDAYKSLGEL